jgi:hypothetical protein
MDRYQQAIMRDTAQELLDAISRARGAIGNVLDKKPDGLRSWTREQLKSSEHELWLARLKVEDLFR